MRRLSVVLVLALVSWIPGHSYSRPAEVAPLQVCAGLPTFGIGLVQSKWGSQPTTNFEAVFPRAGGGLTHYHRENHGPWSIPWRGPGPFGSGEVGGVALVQSNFGAGHLEVVATVGNQLVHYWRDDGGTWAWNGPGAIVGGVKGQLGFVQSSWGTKGNFEVVVPLATGGLAHYWRDNDASGLPWHHTTNFGAAGYDSVSLIESSYGGGQNLEVVARTGTTLHTFYRDTNLVWHGPTAIPGVSAKGSHSLIQSKWGNGTDKNFELVVPLASGGLAHLYRDNGNAQQWVGPTVIDAAGDYTAAAVIQSTYGAGHLEVVARKNQTMAWMWRDDGGSWNWSAKYAFGAEACCPPATAGAWSDPIETGIIGIHSTVLPNGKALWFGFTNTDDHVGQSSVFDPATNQTTPVSGTPNLFCSGHTVLPDGRVWVAGGHHADVDGSHTFNPATNTWTKHGTVAGGRWYPTNAMLPDGRVFTISGTKAPGGPANETGSNINNTWQIFNPATNSTTANTTVTPSPFSPDFGPVDLYPFVYVVPSGPHAGKLMVHSRQTTRFLTVSTNTWSGPIAAKSPNSRTYPAEGTSVLLPLSPADGYRGRVLAIGGAGVPLGQNTPATNSVEMLDLTAGAWQNVAPMHEPRVLPDGVLLPDGKVLVVGGSRSGKADLSVDPVLAPEIYNPATNTWTLGCPMRVPRLYHSTAVLLPDARVLVAGRDGHFNASPYKWPENRAEIYSPPYLFSGPRPVITSAPANVGYGASFTANVTGSANQAVLIKLSSTTHSFNMGQRAVQLTVTGTSPSSMTMASPPNSTVAPPGHYMLFVLSPAGVPSVAKTVKLG